MNISIIIPTYDRCESLRRLLCGIDRYFGKVDIEHEVVVANNAPDDKRARRIDDVLAEFQQNPRGCFRQVRESSTGKCRAMNAAIAQTKGSILAFLDDDVEVSPDWLANMADFFRRTTFDAMQGPILMPPEVKENKEFLRAYHRYRTIYFVEYPETFTEIKTLTGANMAIRREVFSRIGCFNVDLGPGRSGKSEDVEFAQRLRRTGGRIGYEPTAAVYHDVDWSRLTEDYFRQSHEQEGRSRLIFKKQSLAAIILNLMRSTWTSGWYSLVGNERKRYRAKGRYFHYRAMLVEKTKKIKGWTHAL